MAAIVVANFQAILVEPIVLAQGTPVAGMAAASSLKWQIANTDCRLQVAEHVRVSADGQGAGEADKIRILADKGTYVFAATPVRPLRIIDELRFDLWVKSDRPGLQILARVVLPRTSDPSNGGATTTLLRGTSYEQVGNWQRLTLNDLSRSLVRNARAMRAEMKTPVDEREAYVDLVLLNIYGGPGPTTAWIGELETTGSVTTGDSPAASQLNRSTTGSAPLRAAAFNQRAKAASVELQGKTLMVGGRPMFPRMIDYQGESFESLARLEFNTIRLASPATQQQLEEAARIGVWLVAPPPDLRAGRAISAAYDRVLAWHLGTDLGSERLSSTTWLAKQLRNVDTELRRPIACSPTSAVRDYSRIVDIIMHHAAPLGTSLRLDETEGWLRDRQQLARPGTPYWATVQSESARQIQSQINTFHGEIFATGAVDYNQLKNLTYAVLSSGARALCFTSHTPLNATDPDTQRRAATLRLLNRELIRLEPWLATGNHVATLETSARHVKVAVLEIPRSRLLLPIRSGPGSQFCLGREPTGAVTFIVPGVPASNEAFQLVSGRLHPVRHQRVAGGIRVTLDDNHALSPVVLTQDPLVIHQLSKQLATTQQDAAQLQLKIARAEFDAVTTAITTIISSGQQVAAATEPLKQARARLVQSEQVILTGDYQTAGQLSHQVLQTVAAVRRAYWEDATGDYRDPVASPLLVSFSGLPIHWKLFNRLRNTKPGPSMLAGGDFENLNHMQQNGWRHFRVESPSWESQVELSADAPKSGGFSLHLRAWPTDENNAPAVIDSPPLWIRSGSVPVRSDQIVRIHGWARMVTPLQGTRDGMLVFDSLGGKPLGLRVQSGGDWQEFSLYRAVGEDQSVNVSFVLSGLGEAWIDAVSISALESSTMNRAASPVNLVPPR